MREFEFKHDALVALLHTLFSETCYALISDKTKSTYSVDKNQLYLANELLRHTRVELVNNNGMLAVMYSHGRKRPTPIHIIAGETPAVILNAMNKHKHATKGNHAQTPKAHAHTLATASAPSIASAPSAVRVSSEAKKSLWKRVLSSIRRKILSGSDTSVASRRTVIYIDSRNQEKNANNMLLTDFVINILSPALCYKESACKCDPFVYANKETKISRLQHECLVKHTTRIVNNINAKINDKNVAWVISRQHMDKLDKFMKNINNLRGKTD